MSASQNPKKQTAAPKIACQRICLALGEPERMDFNVWSTSSFNVMTMPAPFSDHRRFGTYNVLMSALGRKRTAQLSSAKWQIADDCVLIMQQFSKTAYAVLSFLPYLVRIELQDVESLAPNMRIQPSVPDRKWSLLSHEAIRPTFCTQCLVS